MGEQDEDCTDKKAALVINKASKKNKKIQYLHIETPIARTDKVSVVSEVKISEFDIDFRR